MALHFTTYVMPSHADVLPLDTPFVVIGGDTTQEITSVTRALPTSLHRTCHQAQPISHATPVLGPITVSDLWAAAVDRYDGITKAVIILEPIPADITTEYADIAAGVIGPDLPPWVCMVIAGVPPMAVREILVSSGTDPASIMMDPSAPTVLPDWAEMITPGR